MNCTWSSWGKWSQCTKTCGNGTRLSKRDIKIKEANGGEECRGNDSREESCNVHPCPGMWFRNFDGLYFIKFVFIVIVKYICKGKHLQNE